MSRSCRTLPSSALVLPVGLAVAGQLSRARRALLLAGTGLLLCMALNTRWAELAQALTDGVTRLGFGLPMIAFGLYAATALLGLLLLTPAFIEALPAPGQRRAALAAMTAAAALLGAGLLLCRSRGAWLALGAGDAGVRGPDAAPAARCRARRSRPWACCWSVDCCWVASRWRADWVTTARRTRRLAGHGAGRGGRADLDALPQDSVGLRLRLFGLGFERWRERPFTGHGPNAGDGSHRRGGRSCAAAPWRICTTPTSNCWCALARLAWPRSRRWSAVLRPGCAGEVRSGRGAGGTGPVSGRCAGADADLERLRFSFADAGFPLLRGVAGRHRAGPGPAATRGVACAS